MMMTDIFDKLKTLQVILGRKYELQRKMEEAPKQLSSQDELLAKLKKEFIERNREYEEIKETVYRLRGELDEAVKTREAGEKNMDTITTHREYEALEKQISEASEKEAVVRKELQKEEKALLELDDSIKSTEAMINSQEGDLNTSREALGRQLDEYREELGALESQEQEITPGLDQEILFKFERIIQRNSEGIVAVRNGICTGCHMFLPAQYANEVHEGESILFCPYCSRILYYEESDDDQQETYFNDAGSLADLDDDLGEDDDYEEDTEPDYASDTSDDMEEMAEDEDAEESEEDSESE
ncbi:MAG: nucleic acid-binding protein [Treponemataceae bacterium]|nr:nucleic acid-binding protein [Treponemataceae bacterium]